MTSSFTTWGWGRFWNISPCYLCSAFFSVIQSSGERWAAAPASSPVLGAGYSEEPGPREGGQHPEGGSESPAGMLDPPPPPPVRGEQQVVEALGTRLRDT